MPDMLIRGIPEETKHRLAVRAAENGRSQSAEALEILREKLESGEKNWMQMLIDAAQECGGIELELPERLPGREFSFEEI